MSGSLSYSVRRRDRRDGGNLGGTSHWSNESETATGLKPGSLTFGQPTAISSG